MNTHPLNLLLDTIGNTVTEHFALVTRARAEHPAHESLLLSLQNQLEIHIGFIVANLESYTSIQRDIIVALQQNRGYRTIRAPSHSQLHIHGHCPYFHSGHRIWTLSTLHSPQRTTHRRLLLLGRVPSRDPQDSQRISRLPHSCRSFRATQFSSVASLACQLYYGPRSKQAQHPQPNGNCISTTWPKRCVRQWNPPAPTS
jgi:hypothetical protein